MVELAATKVELATRPVLVRCDPPLRRKLTKCVAMDAEVISRTSGVQPLALQLPSVGSRALHQAIYYEIDESTQQPVH
jgi:hypothetical protein